jgi:hypothetical protein
MNETTVRPKVQDDEECHVNDEQERALAIHLQFVLAGERVADAGGENEVALGDRLLQAGGGRVDDHRGRHVR